jgi:hypothetical protein
MRVADDLLNAGEPEGRSNRAKCHQRAHRRAAARLIRLAVRRTGSFALLFFALLVRDGGHERQMTR